MKFNVVLDKEQLEEIASMLVNKDFIIDRLRGRIKELREENKRYESK